MSIRSLIDRLVNCDNQAWNELLVQAGPIIRALCRRAGLNYDDADDIAQAFVLKLLDSNCRILRTVKAENEDSFYGWIKVIVSRMIIDHVRSVETRRDRELDGGKIRLTDSGQASSPEVVETDVLMDQVLGQLSDPERVLLHLDNGGLKDMEIARILGRPLTTIQQRLTRLRKKIRDVVIPE